MLLVLLLQIMLSLWNIVLESLKIVNVDLTCNIYISVTVLLINQDGSRELVFPDSVCTENATTT